jgi:hypothetical protein
MANHIESVASSSIPKVTEAQFYDTMRPGDLVFCWGSPAISQAIEKFTKGPSHVMKVWTYPRGPWLTLEAEIGKGVRLGPFADYMRYPGDIVLCRRPLALDQVEEEIRFGTTLLDYAYDTVEFASLVARHFFNKLPLIQPEGQLYCSGLQQAIALKSVPFHVPDRPWATPEQLFTESSVSAICARLAPTQ